ncbi:MULTISPECIES: YebG family protein [unclassified Arsukibacterium]|uniref:YebG family protein n=1 Tax=unclassified Arsukibacterium TaxID=2635278 RepID=UPI000C4CC8C7|nr:MULTISPECIES: YebG family protein [unclassified Arsukibacterium]MAA94466.1 damage-inducible protein [Rheinheimera sp.]MBM33477.1 damage-inducible protein [Rheinheimera sp.]HAW91794.1 damage-inducible protein [Candidatus Azambacteria bacterium]|tara:strand:+ start:307 stop:654 length:348 start_codon:yes stop_codon:yes gene_type:complete
MAVVIKYIVERNGVEKMTFTSKAEADAYDKMLDTADELAGFLNASSLFTDEAQTETLALYLAQNKEALLVALGAKKPAKVAEKSPLKKPAKAVAETKAPDETELAANKPGAEQAA